MQTNAPKQSENPAEGDIAALAYQIWEQEGRPDGRDRVHWTKAEGQLKATRQQQKLTVVATPESLVSHHGQRKEPHRGKHGVEGESHRLAA